MRREDQSKSLKVLKLSWNRQFTGQILLVIEKAKIACQNSSHTIADHFADIGKMVPIGSGGTREIPDIMLSRYACYLIAQNGDPRKETIAFAQSYFALQTRKQELSKRLLTFNCTLDKIKIALLRSHSCRINKFFCNPFCHISIRLISNRGLRCFCYRYY